MKRVVEIILFILVLIGLLSIGGCSKEEDFDLLLTPYDIGETTIEEGSNFRVVVGFTLNENLDSNEVNDHGWTGVRPLLYNLNQREFGWGEDEITNEIIYCLGTKSKAGVYGIHNIEWDTVTWAVNCDPTGGYMFMKVTWYHETKNREYLVTDYWYYDTIIQNWIQEERILK